MSIRYLLRGIVARGMFPNERSVVVSDHAGQELTLLVDDGLVVDDKGLVEVVVLQARDRLALVRLPGEVYGPGNIITVNDSQLVETAR